MLTRALLVLLLVLNLGVAAWWALHDAPAPSPPPSQLPGVAMLQLVPSVPTHAAHAGNGATRAAGANDATNAGNAPADGTVAARCYRFGPYANAAALDAARAALPSGVRYSATAVQLLSPPRAWRVVLAQPSHADAVATAARIGAAGFSDYLVMPDTGSDANTIALGRYGNEAAARAHAQALATAGFAASVEAVGAREALWLDIATDPAFAPPATVTPAAHAIDCAGVVRDGRYTIQAPA